MDFSSAHSVAIFPANGLDQSLHAPVLIGLIILTFFREALGWGYAGLVVPGYLAAVFLAAPLTGCLMLVEAIVGYFAASLVGRWIPRSGAWSELFGRERFLLIILVALLTRLGMEAYWVPLLVERYELRHSRELYSIGLVLVPLLTNSFWNAGLFVSLPRVALVSGLTFLFVDFVLLSHTNYTLSRFQIANESVSLAFLETPHAYIILVLGAVLAARDNVLYGWDFNGILVPALLAVAWYEPTKLLTTVIEALVVLFLAKTLAEMKPLSSILIVGSRRMLLAYTVGFVVKWLLGFATLRFTPNVLAIDYFGFGYLLPSLLAVKMWNTDKIGRVLMPTVQVSLTAFLCGNALSIVLGIIDPPSASSARNSHIEQGRSVAIELLLADTAPAPREVHLPWGELSLTEQSLLLAREILERQPGAQGALFSEGFSEQIRIAKTESGALVILPRALDPDDDRVAPRVALRAKFESQPWLVVIDAPEVGSPYLVVGSQVGDLLGARAVVVRSRLPQLRAVDDVFIRELAQQAEIEQILIVGEGPAAAEVSIVGLVPAGLPLKAMEASLDLELSIGFRGNEPGTTLYANRPRLLLSRALAEAAGAKVLGAPEIDTWSESVRDALGLRVRELTSVRPGAFAQPSVEELRLFGAISRGFADPSQPEPTRYLRALAWIEGYKFARVGPDQQVPEAWCLFEPAGDRRRGQASLVIRRRNADESQNDQPLLIELPAPRYERGGFDATLALYEAIEADGLLLAGALPLAAPGHTADPRRAAGRRSHYQTAHEAWLTRGGNALSVHGVAPTPGSARDVLFAFQRAAKSPLAGPGWTLPIVKMFEDNGFTIAAVDGSPELESYSGALDPPMAYARRFTDDQMMLVWLAEEARLLFTSQQNDSLTPARLARAGVTPRTTRVAEVGEKLARCAADPLPSSGCPRATALATCQALKSVGELERYNEFRNPFELVAAIASAQGCYWETLRDQRSGQLWMAVANPDQAWLVPLRPGPVRSRRAPEPGDLERAVALGLATLRVGGSP